MIRFLFACVVIVLSWTGALAQAPKPIRLLLSPAEPPTPALRYQLLPDARLAVTGDAAAYYRQVIELLPRKPLAQEGALLSEWSDEPLSQFPTEEVQKALASYDEVFALLDKGARCDHCEWGVRERLRRDGIGAVLPELQPMRSCAGLLAVRARLELALGRPDRAINSLRNGFALARHVGECETLIHFLVGVAISAMMEKQLDTLISRPNAPNLYFALTDLPVPLISMRRGLEGERLGIHGTFPCLRDVAMNPDAGPLSEKDLTECVQIVNNLSKENEVLPGYLGRVFLVWKIRTKHEIAKRTLIEAGRARDKVEAMPHIQVAMLHALLEYDAALDNLIVGQDRPYSEAAERLRTVNRRYLQERWRNPTASAIPLAPLLLPAVERVTAARMRTDRKIALLRTVEAIRFYAAKHNGQLPPTLRAIKEVPIPLDPATGQEFDYHVEGVVARVHAPVPKNEAPNVGNSVVYVFKMRK
jgi:hypothetical protein